MNKLYLLLLCFFCLGQAMAQNEFITTWKTDNPGISGSTSITIPTVGSGYNYNVDWDNDGTFDEFGITGNVTHDFGITGIYTIRIQGNFPRIHFNNFGDNNKIISVNQWGTIAWTSFANAFRSCGNLTITAIDIPDLSGVTSLSRAFAGTNFSLGLENWNTSSITNFLGVFTNSTMNGDISGWDVSNGTNFQFMFNNCPFNQDISSWNVSKGKNFESMFRNNSAFNQDLSSWLTTDLENTKDMFSGATAFNQNLAAWDMSTVTAADNMLLNTAINTANYDATLIGWNTQVLQSGVNFGASPAQFCLASADRDNMIVSDGWTITDAGLNCSILINLKVYLQGAALNPTTGEGTLMRDDLRTAGIIPSTSPYSDMLTCNISVFTPTGDDAIVDWVWVELRDATTNTTVIESKSALLQRDGDVVATDGISSVEFNQVLGNYYVVIKHQNHLGIMTANTVALSDVTTSVDFTNANNQITYGTNAQTTFGMQTDIVGMWTGNVNGDTIVQYLGGNSDTPSILATILNDAGNFLSFPTYTIVGYKTDDINMDGNTQYTGANPELTFILQNVLAHPGNFLNFSTYEIMEQLPEHINN